MPNITSWFQEKCDAWNPHSLTTEMLQDSTYSYFIFLLLLFPHKDFFKQNLPVGFVPDCWNQPGPHVDMLASRQWTPPMHDAHYHTSCVQNLNQCLQKEVNPISPEDCRYLYLEQWWFSAASSMHLQHLLADSYSCHLEPWVTHI